MKGEFDLDVVTAGAFDGFVTANLNVAEALAAKVAQDLAVEPVMNGAPKAIPQTGSSQLRAVIDLALWTFNPEGNCFDGLSSADSRRYLKEK